MSYTQGKGTFRMPMVSPTRADSLVLGSCSTASISDEITSLQCDVFLAISSSRLWGPIFKKC